MSYDVGNGMARPSVRPSERNRHRFALKRVGPRVARQTALRRRCRPPCALERGRPSLAINLGGDGCRVVDLVCDTKRQCVRSAIFFISEVALLWKMDYLRKTTCDWLCGYDAAFFKLF